VNAFIYSYVFVDDDTAHPYYTNIIDGSDFVVTPTIGCRKIIEEATLITSHQEGELSKPRFKTCKSIKVLPCGVDTNIFKKSPELDKNAIRQAMFDGQVKPGDRLCMISGTKNRQKGIPQAIQTIKALQDIDTHNSYKLYIHMPSIKLKNQTIDLQELIDGNDLKDVFIGDAHFDEAGYHTLNDSELCTIYQAMDCIIIPNIQDGWSFTVHECMACEVLTAISDDHVFHEQVGEGSIKLPCTDYGYAPWNIHEYCRTISPASSARKIIQSFKMKDEIIQTGKAIAHSPKYSWDVIANQWLELMSV
jgi:glycosyltransferase involved in cell wall biosynthesis